MKIIRELPGSYGSKVELVEIDGKQYVLKTWKVEESENEKLFLKTLEENNLPFLGVINNSELKSNQILLEYIEGSPKLPKGIENFIKFGEIIRKMHDIKYNDSFIINEHGEKEVIEWSDFLKNALKRGLKKQRDEKTDLSEELLIAIESFVNNHLPIKKSEFSLLHADLHLGNLLIKNGGLVVYDKNPEIFSGDAIYDFATLLTHYPNGTYIQTDNPNNLHDKEVMDTLIKGYGFDFLKDDRENFDIYFIIKALLRYPSPWEIYSKEAIENIVFKKAH
jgi:thiamine kinase-like enzyme